MCGVRVALDARERPIHCQREKLAIIDGEAAFVCGIDLTTLGGDRYDTPEHPVRSGLDWHDVATRLLGPAVADVAAHAAMRWHSVTGEWLAPAAEDSAPAPTPVRPPACVRGTGRRRGRRAGGAHRCARSSTTRPTAGRPSSSRTYLRAVSSARHLVYLDRRFQWAPEIVGVLAAKLRQPPVGEFGVVVLLPSRAGMARRTRAAPRGSTTPTAREGDSWRRR